MSKQLSRTTVARRGTLRVRLTPYNTVAFPRAPREAIPDLPTCVGRVLKLDAIDGQASNTNLYGGRGHLDRERGGVGERGDLGGRRVIKKKKRKASLTRATRCDPTSSLPRRMLRSTTI